MIPLAVPNVTGNESRYLQECIETGFVSSVGPFVTRLEEMVSRATGAGYSTATASGTTGLHVALIAVGVGRDDLVILPTFTFIGSANAIAHAGASPWLLDINRDGWTLDVAKLSRALQRETHREKRGLIHSKTGRRVGAIMPVHVLGVPADMDAICELARQYQLPVVADAACAIGARYKDRPIGSTGADLSVFSFNGNKTVTSGGGGMVCGEDEALVKKVHHLSTTAKAGADYDFDEVGFNYRMTNLQAAVGCAQMERLDEFVTAKRRIQKRYNDALSELPGVSPFPEPEFAESSCWLAGVILDPKEATAPIEQIQDALREAGIMARPFWKPIHLQRPYAGSPLESTEVADSIWRHILTLPCSTSLAEEDLEQVIKVVRGLLS